MKKWIGIVLVLALVLTMAACGGSSEPTAMDGKWIAMAGEMMGIQVPVKDVFGGDFYFVIQGTGKAEVVVADVSEKDAWSLEGDQFTLEIRGADPCVGTLVGDTVVFENLMDTGLTIIFAREGTEACDPALYDNLDEIMEELEAALGQ